ncbi:uncharacterized protein LACBIDRAFT_291829 [Laccaria bicolor S238N-H82]|uniref:Predicted protein n=1 Tax=Laccaria bicolor (strain S238N-H82 / ATCC MYA-4686) TaxID=486041 RepID=B0CNU0_LACBS|nr:uncharacterized protein LACBIDRAFT_291829 [Laccaria bicolor S238N-H82]EDR15999.1 predicted protein [Laccaria bicolor S238N-H82]|eukprot:XP_001874207.1 predicted protein [Laccaria bicolor S238N-H82]
METSLESRIPIVESPGECGLSLSKAVEQSASANEQLPAQTSQPALSPPRRPTTRSQTGRVPKRRPRDDSPIEIKRIPAPRKKQKTIPKPSPESESDKEEVRSTPSSSRRGAFDDSDEHAKGADTPDSVRVTSENEPSPRSARPRAVLPTPVPFLTKKSRGRRVPTKAAGGTDTEQNARVYICKVEGCGKCFHRGEHLKRHIRSIHTHEKPFKCTFPLCEKYFNRHDNLLQHLKVHKAPDSLPVVQLDAKPKRRYSPPSLSPPITQPHQPYSPGTEPPDSPVMTYPRTIYSHRWSNSYSRSPPPVSYRSTYPSSMSYGPSEPIRFATNMAVSSLRTEIPQSPTESSGDYQRSDAF